MTKRIFDLLEAHVATPIYPALADKMRECLRIGMKADTHLLDGRRKLTLSLYPEVVQPGRVWEGVVMHVTFDLAVLNNEFEAKKATAKLAMHIDARRAAIAYGVFSAEAELLSIQRERDQAARESAKEQGPAESEEKEGWVTREGILRAGRKLFGRDSDKRPAPELLATANEAERQLVLALPSRDVETGPDGRCVTCPCPGICPLCD